MRQQGGQKAYRVSNTTFMHWPLAEPGDRPIAALNWPRTSVMSNESFAERVTLIDVALPFAIHDGSRYEDTGAVIEDRDGSLLGLGTGALVGGPRVRDLGGTYVSEMNAYVLAGNAAPCSAADIAEPFGEISLFDIIAYIEMIHDGAASADINADGALDAFDLLSFLRLTEQGCP